MNKLTNFTDIEKKQLLSKTAYVLPDNPSNKQFSPEQIRKKFYEGFLSLFSLLNILIDNINANVIEDYNSFETEIKTDVVNIKNKINNLLLSNGFKKFEVDFNVSFISNEISGSATKESVNTLLDYENYVGGKILNLRLIDNENIYTILHSKIYQNDGTINLSGVSITSDARLYSISLTLTQDIGEGELAMYSIKGNLSKSANQNDLENLNDKFLNKDSIKYNLDNNTFSFTFDDTDI